MSRRGRWLALGAALVAALLLGRVAVGVLADRWWAAALDPAYAAPVTRLHLLRLAIEATAIALAWLWFALHLLLVVRAVHRVEIPRYLGNLEFRETVRRRTLVALALGAALLLALLAGLGASREWEPIALRLGGGVRYGIADPALERDLGHYVVALPVHAWFQGFAVRLALLGAAVTAGAYALVGAVRWGGGRVATSDPARRHLAALLTLLALALGWGHLLDPARWLATPEGAHAGSLTWRLVGIGASAMAGVALGTAALSAAWAWSARPLLVTSAWIVFTVASLGTRGLLPSSSDPGPPLVDAATRRGLDAVAWGLAGLERPALPAAPESLGLWHPESAAMAVAVDGFDPVAISPGVVRGGGWSRPVWFAVRSADSAAAFVALADDRVAAGGAPLSYRAGDSLAYPGVSPWSTLGPARPGAAGVSVGPAVGV
ncbi:MAG TPA: UPF0182 family protein, partial [Gemmatimonadales bacterium]|nr:UPF0182 family protein [Gemmatimonadales bacterium]